MENQAKVSIIVPVFNNEKDIQETIDSIKQQTYQNWEAIFVDDGSDDKSGEIIKNAIKDDGRFHYLRREREPKGGSTCRNIGASKAQGDYLIFLDGDDVLAPTCLEKRIAAIEGTNYDFMVYTMSMFTNDTRNSRRLTKWGIRDFDYYYITGAPAWQVTSPIYRKEFWDKLNGFDEKFTRSQDIELGLRSVIRSKGRFKMLENIDSDCFYRVPSHESEVPTYKMTKQLESYEFMLDLINRLKTEGCFPNRYKFSLGLLATYSNMFQLIYVIKDRHEKVDKFENYNKVDLRGMMLWHHRLILFLLGKFPLPYRTKRIISLRINQYCRWHFLYKVV